MKKINKLFTVLLFAALSVISCKNNFSELENEIEYTTEKAYLSFGVNESEERMVAPNPITWDDVSSIELKKDGSALKSWTSYAQMKADTSIVLDAGTYTFEVLLKDAAGDILQTGKLENVEIKAGNNSLNFMTKACKNGKGRLSVKCYVDNPISVKKVSVKLDDVVVEALSLNDDRGQLYSPIPLGTAEVDCGNYLITIFINDKKVITDFIEIQNKRETVYNYHYDEKTNVYPVKFLLDDGKDTLVEFGEGKTIDSYITGGELPDPATITNIPDGYSFWGWTCNGEKITKLPENPNGQVIVRARYGMSITRADEIVDSVKSYKITPEDQYYWTELEEAIKDEEITVILDLTNISFDDDKISSGYFNAGGEFSPTVTEIVIPASVTEIEGSAFYECTQLESLTFAEGSGLKTLGGSAFSGCSSLKEIVIPKGVAEFSGSTFNGCTSLKKVTFEEGSALTSMWGSEFTGCTSLEEIVIPAKLTTFGQDCFKDCTSLKKVTFEKDSAMTTLNNNTFNGCTNLESVIFEGNSSLESIGQNVFENCSQLADFVIPSTVTSIADQAFDGCSRLTSKAFSENPNLVSIGCAAFENCISLTSIVIPSNIEIIQNNTFNGCKNLETVTFAENSKLKTIYGSAFENCTSLTEIVIPETVTYFARNAFEGCTNLKNFTIPSSLATNTFFADKLKSSDYKFKVIVNSDVAANAFEVNLGLVEVEISDSVTSIGFKGFSGCTSLKKITFVEGSELSSIGDYAFYYCTSLEEIVIPASVVTIVEYAFYNCENLKKVTFENDSQLNEIQDYAFKECTSLEEISIPASVTSLVKSFFNCNKLKKVTFEGNSITVIPSETFGNCDSLEEITIPSSVKTIDRRAFVYSDNLRNVIFTSDSQCETINNEAFKDCPNVRLIISSDLATNSSFATMLKSDAYKFKLIVNEDLDESAFDANKGLYEVEILANVTKIGNAAFYECENLEKVTFEEGSRLTTIGYGAFHTCNITEIVIPASVTWIKDYAFAYCFNLSKVTYLGDKSKIRFGTDVFNETKVQEN